MRHPNLRPGTSAPLFLFILFLSACSNLPTVLKDLADGAAPPNLPWASRRDLSDSQFSGYFQEYRDRGWIIKDVDAYPDGNGLNYAMIWEANPDNRGWAEWRNLTSDGYHEKWEQYRDQGYIPTDVEGYMSGNNLRFAGIWEENKEGLAWSSKRNLTSQQFGDYFQERQEAGMRIVDIEAYETNSGIRYAAIWHENKNNIQWAEYRDMSRETYQDKIDQFSADGYRVIDFESYTLNGSQKYAAIWEKNLYNHANAVRSNRTESEFANYWRLYRDQGYRLIDFERYETPSGTRYAGVWTENSPRYRWNDKTEVDNLITDFRNNNGIKGISVAIIQNGELKYQRGFGFAEEDRNKDAHGRSIYLTASVSKVIGGTLAAKMESEGELSDGTDVTLDLTQPTTNYIAIPASGHTHTLQQLLSHTGCIWHYSTGPEPSGHFSSAQDATEEIWNTSPLSGCTIGSNRNYSTHAFTFIGAVMESVSNRDIARLIEEEIGEQYGLNSIKVQFRNRSLRSEYERAAPYTDGGSETSYSDNSWKVLGGGIEADPVDLAWFGEKVRNGTIVDTLTRDNRLWTRQPNSRNGLAWEVNTLGGRRVAEHGGSFSGARAHLRVYRDDELVIAILSNQRGHNPADLATSIGNALLD
ncbi:serine hydrolase [Roseivirga sp. BDSF3-8]|uniref:serine hydrolase n=1 Tax=Roseivirga sp. BDSF3-8 TaxID=3241598 RepID=UPI0035325B85